MVTAPRRRPEMEALQQALADYERAIDRLVESRRGGSRGTPKAADGARPETGRSAPPTSGFRLTTFELHATTAVWTLLVMAAALGSVFALLSVGHWLR